MTQPFGHEKLIVYQKGMRFAVVRSALLDKSTTANVLNIAEGNGRYTGTDQAKFYGIAYKAAIQSASLVDMATVNGVGDASRVEEGRELLRRIAAMLTALSKVAAHD